MCKCILLFVEFLEALSSAAATTSTDIHNLQSSSTQVSTVSSAVPQSFNIPTSAAVPPNPLNSLQPTKGTYMHECSVHLSLYCRSACWFMY